MTQAVTVQDCFGFHGGAVKRCSAFKFGMKAFSNPSIDDWLSSCSICVSALSSPESIAVCGSHIPQLLGINLPIRDGEASHTAIIIDDFEVLKQPAFCMDALGALLFHNANKVFVLPPVLDPAEILTIAVTAMEGLVLPKQPLIRKVFGTVEKANEYMKLSLLSLFMRDFVRILGIERRPTPPELSRLAKTRNIPLDSVDDFVNDLKPVITSPSLRLEWESVVDALYDRPTIPRGFNISSTMSVELLSPETPDSLPRRTTKKRSYRDLLDLEMSSASDSDSGDGGLRPKTVKSRSKIPEAEPQPVMEFDNWLQCEKCTKWRKVDSSTVARFEETSFTCPDVPGKSCSDPSEG